MMKRLLQFLVLGVATIFVLLRILNNPTETSTSEPQIVPTIDQKTPIEKIILSHFSDAEITEEPNIIARFEMLQTTNYHPDITALRIIKSVCELRQAGYEDKSMRFIAEIGVVLNDGSTRQEDGINVIFYSEDGQNMECDEPDSISAQTWLELMPEIAGGFSLHKLLK